MKEINIKENSLKVIKWFNDKHREKETLKCLLYDFQCQCTWKRERKIKGLSV